MSFISDIIINISAFRITIGNKINALKVLIDGKANINGSNIPPSTHWTNLHAGGLDSYVFHGTDVGSNFQSVLVIDSGTIFRTNKTGMQSWLGVAHKKDLESFGSTNLLPETKTLKTQGSKTAVLYRGFNIASRTLPTGTGYYDVYRDFTIDIPDETEYVVSFYAKASTNLSIGCYFYAPNTTTSSESSTGHTSTAPDGTSNVDITTIWKKYWVKWKQTVPTAVKSVIIGRITTSGATVDIAGVKLERGSVPTDWSPNPNDVVTDWNETDSNALSFMKNRPTIPTSSDYITTNTNQTGLSGNKTMSGGSWNWNNGQHIMYLSGAVGTSALTFDTAHYGNSERFHWIAKTSSVSGKITVASLDLYGYLTANKFIKAGQNDTQILLAGGGHRPVSDFALASQIGNFVPYTGANSTINLNNQQVNNVSHLTSNGTIQGLNIVATNNVTAQNYIASSRLGYFGTYNVAQTQGIWSIGVGYNASASTTTLGNQYGLAHSYIDVGGSSVANQHQVHFVSNGTAYASVILGSGIFRSSGGYIKVGQDNTQMLLAGGGHRPVSDFALASSVPAQVNLIQGTGIGITGTYPNLTITNTAPNVQANNGLLTLATGAGLTGGVTFSADQATAANFTVGIASTHKLPTITEWNALPTTNTITRLRGTTSGTYTSGDLTLINGAGIGITQSGANLTIANTAPNATHTGDVTGATALTIATSAVTHTKYQNIATQTFLGRATAGTGNVEELTATQVKTVLGIPDVIGNGSFTVQGTGALTGTGSTSANATANTTATLDLTQATKDEIAAGATAGVQIVGLFGDCQNYFDHVDVSAGGTIDVNETFYNLLDPHGAQPTVNVTNHHVHGARLILHSYNGVGSVKYIGEFVIEDSHYSEVNPENGQKMEFTWNEESQVWIYVLPN